MDLNRATLLGRITQDPEVRTTTGGQMVCTISVATNRRYKDQNGALQEAVEYHNCVLWGKLAEIAGQYLSKGRRVYMEGRLQTREWTAQDGGKRKTTEIVVTNMIMLEGPKGSNNSGMQNNASSDNFTPSSDQDNQSYEEEIKVEDIPF